MFFEGPVVYADDALVLEDGGYRLVVIAWDTIEVMSGNTDPMTKGINESTRITDRQAKSAPGTSREMASLTPDQVKEAMRSQPAIVMPTIDATDAELANCGQVTFHDSHMWYASGDMKFLCRGMYAAHNSSS